MRNNYVEYGQRLEKMIGELNIKSYNPILAPRGANTCQAATKAVCNGKPIVKADRRCCNSTTSVT